MPAATRRKRRPDTAEGRREEAQSQPKLPKHPLAKGLKILALVLLPTLFTYVAFVLLFVPRLSVSSQTSVNSDDPFATYSALTNEGQFTAESVRFACIIRTIDAIRTDGAPIQIVGSKDDETRIVLQGQPVYNLTPGEAVSGQCPFSLALPDGTVVVGADVAIVVGFHPQYSPPWMYTERRFHFVTVQSSIGRLRGIQQPMH